MPRYSYQGRTAVGALSSGYIMAANVPEALKLLKAQGIIPLKVEEEKRKKPFTLPSILPFKRRVKPYALQSFCLQMATMLEAGLPVARALTIITQQKAPTRLREIIEQMVQEIQRGRSLHAAALEFKDEFPPMFLNLIAAGEESGNLDYVFRQYAAYLDRQIKLQRELKSALTYPALVLVISLLVGALLTFYVMPRFAEILDTTKLKLPTLTAFLIQASFFLRSNSLLLIILAGILAVGVKQSLKIPAVRLAFDRMLIQLPVVGSIVIFALASRFSRTMAMMLKSGIPFLKNMDFAAQVLGNSFVEQKFRELQQDLSAGQEITYTFQKVQFLPPLLLSLIEVGENSGKLDLMLQYAADYFEQELEYKLKNLIRWLEPGMLLLISGFVGLIAYSLITTVMRAIQSF